MRIRSILMSLVAAGCASAPVEEHGAEHGGDHPHGAGTQALNVFVGGVDEIRERDGRAVGLDYEFRFADRWGVGGFAESVVDADRSFAGGAQLYWHAAWELVLVAGAGWERRDGEAEGILRVGGFYEFPLGNGFVLSPGISYDFGEAEDVLVYGLNVGYVW